MNNFKRSQFKPIMLRITHSCASHHKGWSLLGLFSLMLPLAPLQAAEEQDASRGEAASFNSSFLNGKSRGEDLSRFNYDNPVLAGSYSADIFINGHWQGTQELIFRNVGKRSAETCFSLTMLEQLGVDTAQLQPAVLNGQPPAADTCLPISQWIPVARSKYDSGSFRMDIEIPQAFLRRSARGFVNPKIWDHGITAGKIGYNFNAYQADTTHDGDHNRQRNAFLSLNAGFNLGDWQFHHDSNLNWHNGDGVNWQRTATYARYPVQRLRGIMTLGESFTSGEIFNSSIGFRGIQLATDDRMLPDSLSGYAPIIRGAADTNALVEIYQNGRLLYQTSVPQGPFVIDDLYPTGYGGDLDVVVNEATGQKHSFKVPYASVAQLLRPGVGRYNVTVGEVRQQNLRYHPNLIQATFQRGLTNTITGYTGAALSEQYSALALGSALSTSLGAFSFDVIHSNSRYYHNENSSGQSYKIGYSKLIPETQTNFTFAAYRYSTRGYINLENSFTAHDYDRMGRSINELARQRNEFQVTLTQPLADGWGSFFMSSSLRDYWNRDNSTREYQLGYTNNIGIVNYTLQGIRSRDSDDRSTTRYYVTASLPIGASGGSTSLSTNLAFNDDKYDNSQATISGTMGRRSEYSYHATVSDQNHNGQSASLGGQYNSPYADLSAMYSQSRHTHQASIGASGTIVAHAHGITMTPARGETMALVEAPDAAGALVGGNGNIRVDDSGYAVVPYMTPYRLNTVDLSPGSMSNDVELETTSRQVAPYAGAIVKLNYPTKSGTPLLIKVTRANGEKLPFGISVVDEKDQNVGIVGQGSRIFLRTSEPHNHLKTSWGADNQSCTFEFDLTKTAHDTMGGYQILEAQCEE